MPNHIPPYAGIYFEYFDLNRPGPQWLPQVSLSSVTKLHHTASRTLLTQVFINPSTVSPISSAKYTFPLYESCAIVVFRCYVGRQLIEGIIKEKEDASATYQAAVERNEPASLLEQHTTDVFSTSIGNIPAGETVKVEIEYIMELKHDAEVDGLRFTIPTSIAPRYGALPSGLGVGDASRAVTARNMNISVEVSMSSSINSVQSPSHPISLYLGGHSTDTPDAAFNSQQAFVTLGQTTTELGKDFILLIKCASLSSPAALLESHPTIPNSTALMVTLVPKFNLPKSAKPEVVFIVDRSGSMTSRVVPLKSSLSVFLKSLPLDVNFNICSFGSHHSFLWDISRPYSNQSFAEAQQYCDHMEANFGGTEILPAIKSTIERRLKDLNLEIMVLTDGQVWNSGDLFKYVEKETEKGDVRLFSLGIGLDVSHALIDGLARVGRGFSQVVSDAREGMESKVARMLRGGLSAHVTNYRLEWEGKPSVEAVRTSSSPITSAPRHINLFDAQANADSPVSFFDSPDFTIPSVIQAPYKIQPLFPFSRSNAYALLSSDARPPSRVWLRGTTPEGDELELEIAVQRLPGQGETIHQLAARKVLQELKDGTSYLHGAVDKERQPGLLAEWVKKEGVRVGLKYGMASQWTSFVAVERKEEEVVVVEADEERQDQRVVNESTSGLDDDDDWDTVAEAGRASYDGGGNGMYSRSQSGAPAAPLPGGFSVPVMMMRTPPPPPIPYPTRKHSYSSKHSGTLQKGKYASAPKSGKSDYSDYLPSMGSHSYLAKRGSVTPLPDTVTSLPQKSLPLPPTYDSLPLIGSNPTGKMMTAPSPPPMPYPTTNHQSYSYNHSGTLQKGESAAAPKSGMSGYSDSLPPKGPHSYLAERSSVTPLPEDTLRRRSLRLSPAYGSSNPLPLIGNNPTGKGPERESDGKPAELCLMQQIGPSASASNPPSAGSATLYSPDRLDCNLNFSSPSVPPAGATPGGAYESFFRRTRERFGRGSNKKLSTPNISTPDIGISYSPSSAPPPQRLSADTGIQPLSSRTKTLIDLQTFEGCFVLNSALAALLGVSISDLEARFTSVFVPGLSLEHGKQLWATVLAIKLFETQLAGERSVWQLVVDKGRAWMRGLAGVRAEDITLLEKMAGEVLGV